MDNDFSATRRLILKGAGVLTLVGLGIVPLDLTSAYAAANDKYPEDAFKQKSEADAIKALYGKTAEPSDKVKLDAPEIAENGAVVPVNVEVTAPMTPASYIKTIWIVADKNRIPIVARATLTPEAGHAFVGTNIRLGETTDVRAVVEQSDGTLLTAKREVKVTVGGCGG
jgi:sulfur-oxidizing protein SoxY